MLFSSEDLFGSGVSHSAESKGSQDPVEHKHDLGRW